MSEFITKIANALQELVKYSVISKIQTGDRTFDNLLSATVLIVITHVINPTFFNDIRTNCKAYFYTVIDMVKYLISTILRVINTFMALMPASISQTVVNFIPPNIVHMWKRLCDYQYNRKSTDSVIPNNSTICYLPDSTYEKIKAEMIKSYMDKYFDPTCYSKITWYTSKSIAFNSQIIKFVINEMSFVNTQSTVLRFGHTIQRETDAAEPTLESLRPVFKDKKIPVFIYNDELIVLNYDDSWGFYLYYRSYSVLEVFHQYIMRYMPKHIKAEQNQKESKELEEEKKNQESKAHSLATKGIVYTVYVTNDDNCKSKPYGVVYADRDLESYVSRYKPKIKSLLDNFVSINQTGKSRFGRYGTYNLGFMLYGKPGCGKTLLTKVIANYLVRDIHIVDMRKIKTKTVFERLFEDINKKVFVFDEFDCVQGVLSRELTADGKYERKVSQEKATIMKAKLTLLKSLNEQKEDKEKDQIKMEIAKLDQRLVRMEDDLTLDTILTVLDGVKEMRGRVIIANTNHIDRIDPALLRDGRFDMKLHMTEFNEDEIRDLLCMMYESSDARELIMKSTFPSGIYTPTNIMNICYSIENLPRVIDVLRRGENTTTLSDSTTLSDTTLNDSTTLSDNASRSDDKFLPNEYTDEYDTSSRSKSPLSQASTNFTTCKKKKKKKNAKGSNRS